MYWSPLENFGRVNGARCYGFISKANDQLHTVWQAPSACDRLFIKSQ
jgi:hypothetical protein